MTHLLDMNVREALEKGYTVTSPAQKKAQENYNRSKEQGRGKGFVMQKLDNYQAITNQLTLGQKGVLLLLTTAMHINENGKLYKNKEERLTVEDVSKMIGKKPKQTYNILSELEVYGLISKEQSGKNVYVSISEGFYTCGSLQEKMPVVKVFKAKLQEVAKILTHNELGLLADLLAHMHYSTHLLCSNPTEQDTSKLELWRAKDVVELLGVSKPTVLKALKKFRENGITFEVRTVRDVILLDPELVAKQAKELTLKEVLEVVKASHLSSKNYRK